MKHRTEIIIGVVGAAALWIWYRQRSGQPVLPAVLAGQGTRNSDLTNPGATGQTPTRPHVDAPAVALDEVTRLAARAQATGPLSRGQCLYPRRWIDSNDGPYYGVCVSQAEFTNWTSTFRGDVITNNIIGSFLGRPVLGGVVAR